MRKLLSLLTVLTLTTPVPLNVIACGGTKTPPVVDDTDYLTLKQTAQDKIQTKFANLINDSSNLRKVSDVTNGKDIIEYLKSFSEDKNIDPKEKKGKATIDGFLEVLKTQVLTISNNLVSKYPELKPLFNGINPNDILKINTDDLDKILTYRNFIWRGKDFGVAGFDADKYGITAWYHLTANLQLDFTCLGENAKVNTTTINQSYDMYFANDGSDLNQAVDFITNDVKGKLDKQGVVKVEYTTANPFDDSFVNKKTDILNKIKTNLENIIPKLTIATTQLTNLKDYHYMNRTGTNDDSYDNIDHNPLTMIKLKYHLDSTVDFNSAWKTPVDNRLNDFQTVLDKWIADNKLTTITNPDKIFVIGNYKTTNWSIDGLELKTISIPYYVSGDKTRIEDTQDSLDIVDKLFVGANPLFIYPKNISELNSGHPSTDHNFFNFNIPPTDFDNFVKDDVSLQEIYEYITNKTTAFLAKQSIIGNIAWVNSNLSNSTQKKH
ncbi:hypothetical protein [Spiroplasma sp. AdecLV25b]|uniref:hypothetical protein n=1 Tax=Spiroplasma sp. AdecLV25b TaxID=3027162 RepID=UPI0027E0D1E5|nr:hypothetical protein [Spiroplasma sp. AdecLV25b]